MKTIIAGSRDNVTYQDVEKACELCGWTITEVFSGTARGADKFGEEWAAKNNIPITRFPANWELYGKSAGYRRNLQMAENADALVAIWNQRSKGTKHMINNAKDKGLKVYVFKI